MRGAAKTAVAAAIAVCVSCVSVPQALAQRGLPNPETLVEQVPSSDLLAEFEAYSAYLDQLALTSYETWLADAGDDPMEDNARAVLHVMARRVARLGVRREIDAVVPLDAERTPLLSHPCPLVRYAVLRCVIHRDARPVKGYHEPLLALFDAMLDADVADIFVADGALVLPGSYEGEHEVGRGKLRVHDILVGATVRAATPGTPLFMRRVLYTRLRADRSRMQLWRIAYALRQGAEAGTVDPWLAAMVSGKEQMDRAWAARGSDSAYRTSSQQFASFGSLMEDARDTLLHATELEPFAPEPFAELINIEMGSGVTDRSELEWFLEVLKREHSHAAAHHAFRYGLRPRWGGSLSSMQAYVRWLADMAERDPFDLEILASSYDAYVEELYEVRRPEQIFREQRLFGAVHDAYTAHSEQVLASLPFDLVVDGEWLATARFLSAFLAGRYDAAAEAVDAFGRIPRQRWMRSNFGLELVNVAAWVLPMTGEHADEGKAANQLEADGALDEAADAWAALLEQTPEGPRYEAVQHRALTARWQADLARGETIRVRPEDGFCGLLSHAVYWQDDWSMTDEGVFWCGPTNEEQAVLQLDVEPPPAYEMTFIAHDPVDLQIAGETQRAWRFAGFALLTGRSGSLGDIVRSEGLGMWLNHGQISAANVGVLSNLGGSDTPVYNQKLPVRCTLRVRDGRYWARLGDRSLDGEVADLFSGGYNSPSLLRHRLGVVVTYRAAVSDITLRALAEGEPLEGDL